MLFMNFVLRFLNSPKTELVWLTKTERVFKIITRNKLWGVKLNIRNLINIKTHIEYNKLKLTFISAS